MGYADRFLDTGPSRQELHAALLGSALQFGETVRRFEHRCRARGFDRSSSVLLDQVHLSRSLLLALAQEMNAQHGPAARSRSHA